MTAATIYDAVSDMARLFTDYFGVDNVELPNRKFELPQDNATTWARFSIQHTDGGQGSLSGGDGSRMWTRTGIGTIELFNALGTGAAGAYQIAEAVVNLYQGKRTPSGVWFRNVRFEEDTSTTPGPWFKIDVLFNFTYDQIS